MQEVRCSTAILARRPLAPRCIPWRIRGIEFLRHHWNVRRFIALWNGFSVTSALQTTGHFRKRSPLALTGAPGHESWSAGWIGSLRLLLDDGKCNRMTGSRREPDIRRAGAKRRVSTPVASLRAVRFWMRWHGLRSFKPGRYLISPIDRIATAPTIEIPPTAPPLTQVPRCSLRRERRHLRG